MREVPRKVQRLMERDNKKLRDAGKKQRNEEIRQLVSFVRKRDPRVKAYIVSNFSFNETDYEANINIPTVIETS